MNPEVLLIDEVLAVGDLAFLVKAKARMRDLMNTSRVMVMVAHDLVAITEVCNRVVWMEKGQIKAEGDPREIVSEYILACVKNPPPELALALGGTESKSEAAKNIEALVAAKAMSAKFGMRLMVSPS